MSEAEIPRPKERAAFAERTALPFHVRLFRLFSILPNFGLLIVLILAWQFASKVWLPSIDPYMAVLMPAPTSIVVTAAGMIASGELLFHLMASLKREAVAFLLSMTAIPLGIAMGWSRVVYNQVNPIMEILRPIPPLAWIPLAIVFFGVGNTSATFLIFLASFFPITVSAMNGVRNVPSMFRRDRKSVV